jgi:TPR repeat protein
VNGNLEGNMAYTSLEVNEATDAVIDAATTDDLFKLGLIYSTDVEDRGPDYVEAHKWFSLAAMMGSAPAKAYRDDLKFEMSSEDLTLAQKAARGWLAENRTKLAA